MYDDKGRDEKKVRTEGNELRGKDGERVREMNRKTDEGERRREGKIRYWERGEEKIAGGRQRKSLRREDVK